MGKLVTIQIASSDLDILKADGYILCFARCVEDSYDVIWQSYANYLASNPFSWSALYRLFGSNAFSAGAPAGAQTNAVDIALGQQATLDRAGVLGSAVEKGAPGKISLINNYGPIHPGLSGISTGLDAVQRMTPMFVAPRPIVTGSYRLHPTDKVKVWFEQNGASSTIGGRAVSNAVEIDLTDDDTATRLYQNGDWTVPTNKPA
jgi:hypothetical protein